MAQMILIEQQEAKNKLDPPVVHLMANLRLMRAVSSLSDCTRRATSTTPSTRRLWDCVVGTARQETVRWRQAMVSGPWIAVGHGLQLRAGLHSHGGRQQHSLMSGDTMWGCNVT